MIVQIIRSPIYGNNNSEMRHKMEFQSRAARSRKVAFFSAPGEPGNPLGCVTSCLKRFSSTCWNLMSTGSCRHARSACWKSPSALSGSGPLSSTSSRAGIGAAQYFESQGARQCARGFWGGGTGGTNGAAPASLAFQRESWCEDSLLADTLRRGGWFCRL